jgi:hypothetical protein
MKFFPLLSSLSLISSSAIAGNSLIAENQPVAVAKAAMIVKPGREWNKMGARPGRYAESWTLDGDTLNELTFYGGVESGRTLFREVDKRNKPLPHFSTTMLLTDIPVFLEESYRIALGTTLMSIGKIEPATFAGRKGVRFEYAFTRQGEELRRRGEGYATIADHKLFMITFEAPVLYYFDASVGAAREVIQSAMLPRKG